MSPLPSHRLRRHLFSVALAASAVVGTHTGCGGGTTGSGFADGGSSGGGSGSSGSNSGSLLGDGGGSGSGSGGGVKCPPGYSCNVSCSGGGTTSISGTVYDPAGKNPLYDVVVYVPAVALQPLPKGVPTGSDACNCGALFKSGAVVATTTGVDGTFKLTNAPVGKNVPLVIQIGKWRKQVTLDVAQCTDNTPSAKLSFPSSVAAGDTNDSMPEIAVSTGAADTLECLMHRIGLPASEYVAGAGGSGHVHVFSGGGNGNPLVGSPEQPPMKGAPNSDSSLWDTQADMMPYDIVLLSCEGAETYNAKPDVLEQYLNAGGRAFGSHYHYAWFAGPLQSKQSYSAPSDWGNALATWSAGTSGSGQANGKIVQTLNGSTKPFAKGQALYQWLQANKALGVMGAPASELPMIPPRYNAQVGPNNKPSQAWVNDDKNGETMYFSFDTPVGSTNVCGRAVFSDLHVGGETKPADNPPPPNGCTTADLSPQEKALEFMLFDLSACVIPDTEPPSDAGIPILQ